MPATSVAQRKFFGMLEHHPEMAKEKGIHMTHQQMHDFAATKDTGLPQHVSDNKHGILIRRLMRQ